MKIPRDLKGSISGDTSQCECSKMQISKATRIFKATRTLKAMRAFKAMPNFKAKRIFNLQSNADLQSNANSDNNPNPQSNADLAGRYAIFKAKAGLQATRISVRPPAERSASVSAPQLNLPTHVLLQDLIQHLQVAQVHLKLPRDSLRRPHRRLMPAAAVEKQCRLRCLRELVL